MAAAIADTVIDTMETLMAISKPDVPDVFPLDPYEITRPSLDDDPAFMQLLKTMESQSEAMREQLSALREQSESLREQSESMRAAERSASRFAIASLVVAALSLAVTFVSLLGQFGAIG